MLHAVYRVLTVSQMLCRFFKHFKLTSLVSPFPFNCILTSQIRCVVELVLYDLVKVFIFSSTNYFALANQMILHIPQ